MAHLVETSEEDSWLVVATYIGELIDAEQVSRLEGHRKRHSGPPREFCI